MEKEHPIHKLMDISLEHILDMIDVSKIIGEPIIIDENRFVIPISKVSFGFGAAGSEFDCSIKEKKDASFPFGGGSGGGVTKSPFSFLCIDHGKVSIIYAEKEETLIEKIFETILKKENKE